MKSPKNLSFADKIKTITFGCSGSKTKAGSSETFTCNDCGGEYQQTKLAQLDAELDGGPLHAELHKVTQTKPCHWRN